MTPRAATSEAGAAPRRAVPGDGGPIDGEASTTRRAVPADGGRPTARLALHHLLDEAHTGMGDAREELKPNLVGDVRPVAVKTTSS